MLLVFGCFTPYSLSFTVSSAEMSWSANILVALGLPSILAPEVPCVLCGDLSVIYFLICFLFYIPFCFVGQAFPLCFEVMQVM